ncbi:MAG: hypothetical protein ACHQ1D_01160 [Nitrososphaerales archaeon]
MSEDFSCFFTVEFYGAKGWEVLRKCLSFAEACDFVDVQFPGEYQYRITTPEIKRNELVAKLEEISEAYGSEFFSEKEFADRIVQAVKASL